MAIEVNEATQRGVLEKPALSLGLNSDLGAAFREPAALGELTGKTQAAPNKRTIVEHYTSFRDKLLPKATDADIGVIRGLFEGDPRLDAFAGVFEKSPGMDDPQARAKHIKTGFGDVFSKLAGENPGLNELSAGGKEVMETFVQFYHCYLTPFPDKTETEAATSLFELASGKNDQNRWDVVLNQDQHGNIMAASSGQIINGDTLWGEHAWRLQDPVMRGSRAGTNVIKEHQEVFKARGAQRMMVEVDNPFALSDDPKAHDMSDVAGRRGFWAAEGQAMDPYDRLAYHSNTNNLHVLVQLVREADANGRAVIKPMAVNNSQIALEGNDEGCRTISSCVKMLTPKAAEESKRVGEEGRAFLERAQREGVIVEGIDLADITGGMSIPAFQKTYSGMQETIDENYALKPEYTDAMADLQKAEGKLIIVHPLSKTGLQALAARAENERKRANTQA